MTGSAFRFRLERVRKVRERSENVAKQELARAIAHRSLGAEELRTAQEHVEHARNQQRIVGDGAAAVSASELMARQAFLERAEARREQSAHELRLRDSEVAERDASLASAAVEHEMLNRLRQRHLGEHTRELDRKERGSLDEIATQRFGRSSA
jgi:flagellar export protein FliJ